MYIIDYVPRPVDVTHQHSDKKWVPQRRSPKFSSRGSRPAPRQNGNCHFANPALTRALAEYVFEDEPARRAGVDEAKFAGVVPDADGEVSLRPSPDCAVAIEDEALGLRECVYAAAETFDLFLWCVCAPLDLEMLWRASSSIQILEIPTVGLRIPMYSYRIVLMPEGELGSADAAQAGDTRNPRQEARAIVHDRLARVRGECELKLLLSHRLRHRCN